MTDARHWCKPSLCKVLVSWDIRNLYSLFQTDITMSYHKDQETIMRIISQDITKSFEESRGLWSSRISTLHGTRTVGCQWAQTVAQLGDIDSGWYLDSAIYFIGKNHYIYIRHIWGWLLSKIPSKDYHHVSLWILGMAHWLQEQMSWILHPLEITVCNPKMCKAHQGPSKGEDCFPSAPFLLGTMAVSFRECIDPCEPPDCPPQLAISTTDPKACQTGCRIHPSFAVAFQIPKHYIIQNQSDWHGGEITIE